MRGPTREAQGDQSNRESTPEADNSEVDSVESRTEAETLEADTPHDTFAQLVQRGRAGATGERATYGCRTFNRSKNRNAITMTSRTIVYLTTCTMKRR